MARFGRSFVTNPIHTRSGARTTPAPATNADAGVATGTGAVETSSEIVAQPVGLATATGTAQSPVDNVQPRPPQAAGVGAGLTLSEIIAQPVGLSSGVGAANAPNKTVAQPVGLASATGSASNTLENVSQPCGLATGTGVANASSEAVSQPVGLATSNGTAFNATASTATSTNADAGLATGTGVAFNPSASIRQSSGSASGTGSSQNANQSVRVNPSTATSVALAHNASEAILQSVNVATATGSAFNIGVSVQAKPTTATATGSALNPLETVAQPVSLATATGTANNPSESVAPSVGQASGTGTCFNAQQNVLQPVSLATATGTAYNAVANTAGATNAFPTVATGTGIAYNPALGVTTGTATGTGLARQPALGVGASLASGTGSGNNTQQSVRQTVGVATGIGTAQTPRQNVSQIVGLATGTGSALNPSEAVGQRVSVATGTGSAFNIGQSIGQSVSTAVGTGTRSSLKVFGTAFSNAYSANSAPIDITGDIEIVVCVAYNNWTPSPSGIVIGKGYGQSWFLYLQPGTIGLSVTHSGGTAFPNVVWAGGSRPAPGAAAWLRVQRNATTGVVSFDINTDGSSRTEPTSWTNIGTNNGVIASMSSTTAPLGLGAGVGSIAGAGSERMAGQIFRAIVRDGIGGTTVFDADFNIQLPGTTSFAESINAATVTVGTAARIGTLFDPAANVQPNTGAATGSGSANNNAVGFGLSNASGSGSAQNDIVGVGTTLATATGTAYNPVAQTSGNTSAFPGVATGTGSATTLTAEAVGQSTIVANGTGTAFSAGQSVSANLGVATATGTAFNPTAQTNGSTNANVSLATATGIAQTVTEIVAQRVGVATGTGLALQPRQNISQISNIATATGTANEGTERVAPAIGKAIGGVMMTQADLWLDARASTIAGGKISNMGLAGSGLDAKFGSTTGVEGSDPIYLPYDGSPYIYSPGNAGNYLAINDSALFSWSDLDVRVRVRLNDWTPSILTFFGGTWVSPSSNRSWYVGVDTSGKLRVTQDLAGDFVSNRTHLSSVAPPLVDGEWYWVRYTLDTDNGASGTTARFYYAADQDEMPGTWTQIGTDVVTAGALGIFNSSQRLAILTIEDGGATNSPTYFKEFWASNVIDGSAVVDVKTSVLSSGAVTSFNEVANNLSVLISRPSTGTKTVAVTQPVMMLGTDDYLQIDADPLGAYVNLPGSAGSYISTPDASDIDILGSEGTHFLALAGQNGNGASIPDSAALDITTDIELVARFRPNGALVTSRGIINKNNAYRLLSGSADASAIWFGMWDGATWATTTSSTGVLVSNTTRWIKVTRDQATGTVNFYYAADQATEPVSWTSAGSAVVLAGTALLASANNLEIGSRDANIAVPYGDMFRAIVRNGIAGTAVADANFTLPAIGTTSFTATAGGTCTINGTASKIVDGTTYLFLSGIAGSFASIPNSAALQLVGDKTLIADVALSKWAVTSGDTYRYFVGKRIGGTGEYFFRVDPNSSPAGCLQLVWYESGVSKAATSTVAPTISNGQRLQVAVTHDVDNGAGGNDVRFFTRATDNDPWVQLGSTVTQAFIAAPTVTTTAVVVGAEGVGGNQETLGKYYKVGVYNGIGAAGVPGGTAVLDMDFSRQIQFATSFVENSSNLATVTVNGATSRIERNRDIDIIIRASATDWTPASGGYTFLAKRTDAGSNQSYSLRLTATGTLSYNWSVGGSGAPEFFSASSTVPVGAGSGGLGFTNNRAYWLRVTHDTDTGSGSNTVTFYYATDNTSQTIPSSWTQIGSPVTATNFTSIARTASVLEIGSRNVGVNDIYNGNIYRAVVRNGIAGSITADFNAALFGTGSLTGTDFNAHTWTINGSAQLANANPLNFNANQDFTVMLVARTWDAGTTFRSYVSKRDTSLTGPNGYEMDFSGVNQQIRASVGTYPTILDIPQTNRWIAGEVTVASILRDNVGFRGVKNITSTSNTSTAGYYGDTGSITPFRVGARYPNPSEFADVEVFAVVVWRRALTLSELTQVSNYYGTLGVGDNVAPNNGSGSGSGSANNPGQSVLQPVGRATATGVANSIPVKVAQTVGLATATGTALNVVARISANVSPATGTGTALDPVEVNSQNAGQATATGTALDATFHIGIFAFAGIATAVGEAHLAFANQFTEVRPDSGTGSGTAHDPSVATYVTWTDESDALKPTVLIEVEILNDNPILTSGTNILEGSPGSVSSNNPGPKDQTLSDNDFSKGKNISLGSFKKLD